MADPTRVLVAGDWHGNTDWAVGVIEQLPYLLPDEEPRIVLHAGDFGIWPGRAGLDYLGDVGWALADAGAELWFVDGNHDDHDQLARQVADHGRDRRIQQYGPTEAPWRCWWLPRGHRWTWHGRTWLALGGAVSVDHRARTAGRSWWPGETLQDDDLEVAINAGPADVVLAHDCPKSVHLDHLLPRPAPHWWDVARADAHRGVVQLVADAVRPAWWLHGHYHLSHHSSLLMNHGWVEVTGLHCDGATHGAHRVLDVRTMTWET